MGKIIMFFETEHLILRKFQEDDFDDFCEYAMDDEMSRMTVRNLLHSIEDARWNFDWLKDKEDRCYGLVYMDTGRIIGNLTVCDVPKEILELEKLKGKTGKSISYSISRKYQRKGLMFEAASAVIRQLFYVEGIDYIHWGHFPFNTSSEMLQKKLGFEYLTTMSYYDEGKEIVVIHRIIFNHNK
jgi:RimJ/RimL family protein N-acetyltransferase